MKNNRKFNNEVGEPHSNTQSVTVEQFGQCIQNNKIKDKIMEDKLVLLTWIFVMMLIGITSQIKTKVDKIEKMLEDKNDK